MTETKTETETQREGETERESERESQGNGGKNVPPKKMIHFPLIVNTILRNKQLISLSFAYQKEQYCRHPESYYSILILTLFLYHDEHLRN